MHTARMDLSPRCSRRDADTRGHTGWDLLTGNTQNRQMIQTEHGFMVVRGWERVGRPARGDRSPLRGGMFWN